MDWNNRLGLLALGGKGEISVYSIDKSDVDKLLRGKRAAKHTSHLAGADAMVVAKQRGGGIKGVDGGISDVVAAVLVLDTGKLVAGG